MRLAPLLYASLTLIVSLVGSTQVAAQSAPPAYDGDGGFFFVPHAVSLGRGAYGGTAYRNNLDRNPKDEDFSAFGLAGSLGLGRGWEVFGSYVPTARLKVQRPGEEGVVSHYPFTPGSATGTFQTGTGDLWLGVKKTWLEPELENELALATRVAVKLPLADEKKGLGTGSGSLRIDLIASKDYDWRGSFGALFGVQFDEDSSNVPEAGNAFRWGAAFRFPTSCPYRLVAELVRTHFFGDSPDQIDPLDLNLGVELILHKRVFVRPAFSTNLNFGYRNQSEGRNRVGFSVAIGMTSQKACCK